MPPPDKGFSVNPWAEERKKALETTKEQKTQSFIKITDKTRVNPDLLTPVTPKTLRGGVKSSHRDQLYARQEHYAELVLGLDFGTANTKVVIMETGSENAWAVEFTKDAVNPYLMPSRVYRQGEEYSLVGGGTEIANLKLPLLLQEKMEAGHIDHVVAFLALIIRYARQWFFKHHGDNYPDAEFAWHYHIGLPASNYSDETLVDRFKTLILAAAQASLAAKPVSGAIVRAALGASHKAVTTGEASDPRCHPAMTQVFPEIAAQLHGYVKSDRWDRDRPKFMLIDIGGGTVDACILNVTTKAEGELRYSFLKSSVQPRGVVMLHRDRLRWIRDSIAQSPCSGEVLKDELNTMSFSQDNTLPLPGCVTQYLIGAQYPPKNECSDHAFYNRYGKGLWDDVIAPVKTRIDPSLDQWKSLPFLLCGGGSLHPLYQRFVEKMNGGNTGTSVKLSPIQLGKPDNLKCPKCTPREYHRLSVAYGLAHWELGEILNESQIDDLEINPFVKREKAVYVGKEFV